MSWVWEITQERHIGILCFDSPFRKSCCYFISSQQITWCSGEENRADSDTKDVINAVVFWHITSDSSPVERVCTFCVVKLIVKNLNPMRLPVTFVWFEKSIQKNCTANITEFCGES